MTIVVFTEMPVKFETEVIQKFLHHSSWKKHILSRYPELENINPKYSGKIIFGIHNSKAHEIAESRERFQRVWKEIEADCFNMMQEIVGTEWPNRPTIKGMVSINPINPRFLDDWSFGIFYRLENNRALETIAHEILHFLYFKKWAEIHPKSSRKNWESPHLEWMLSELVAPIVLNDSRMRSLLVRKASFYPDHESIIIDGKPAPHYFTEIYLRQIGKTNGFELFLSEAFEKLKKYWPNIKDG